ncbi:hypothetical protein HaLaN_27517 [Haematococcus lacustris]|uniref:Uncharacterized protein n=1 Tax=Haematococcus lacustris TaxID=44745 RepID=A0A6A0A8R4_HAELA|nr:hypothetical protein HaLaN_27517 [Haematococcus lacustris]
MPLRKRPSSADEDPHPIESPRAQVSSALLTSLLFMPAQVQAPLQANNARSEGLNGKPSDDRYARGHIPPCMPPHCLCPGLSIVSRPVNVACQKCGLYLAAGHQSPGWRCVARVQENPPQADGALPAEGWGAQPAPRHRVTVCVADFSDVPGGLPHPGVPQRPHTSSRAASPCTGCCTPTPTPPATTHTAPTQRPPCCPPPPTSSSHWATHALGQRRSSNAAAAAGVLSLLCQLHIPHPHIPHLETEKVFNTEPARSNHWDRWFSTKQLANQGRVSSAVNGQQPCERQLNKRRATSPASWKPPAGQVEPRLLRPAWSQQHDQPVRGMMWCPVVAPRKPPQAPRSSQEALQPAASEPGPSTPLPAKRSKRTKAEQAVEPTQPTKGTGKAQGKAAKAKPAPQPGRWLDRDCNAALNMQRIGESRWRPLELCYWPEQGKLPAKGKEYPGLGYKRLRDKQLKAQQQPAAAQ